MNVKVPMIEVGIGQRGDERDAQVADEQEDDDAGEQAAEEQVQLDVLERRRMKRDWSLPMLILMSGGSVRLDPLELAPARGRRPRRCWCPTACGSTCRPPACSPSSRGRAADFLRRVLHAADVAERDRPSRPAVGEDDAVEVVDVLDPAHRPQRDFGRAGDEAAAGDLDVLPLDRGARPGRRSGRRR